MAWLYAWCSVVMTVGLYLDGWSHQFIFNQIDSFFNPWHAVLYAGFAACAVTLAVWTYLRRSAFRTFADAVPPGHGLSAYGAIAFLWGGIADLTWHQLFGFEKDIEGFISPTHLVLAAGMALMLAGNVRHWSRTHARGEKTHLWTGLPLVLGMLCMLAQWTFLTQYGRYTDFTATGIFPDDAFYRFCTQTVSILGILVFSALLSGLFTYVGRRASIPFGSVTVVLTAQVFMLAMIRYGIDLVPAGIAAGISGDVLLRYFPKRLAQERLLVFAFTLPALFYTAVLLVLHVHGGLWWSMHIWSGVPVFAGAAGLLAGLAGTPMEQGKETDA